MAENLFRRSASVVVGIRPIAQGQGVPGKLFDGLRIVFKVARGTSPSSSTPGASAPSPATITIYNLSPESRAACAVKDADVVLGAGYQGNEHAVFVGQVIRAMSEREGPDWKTTIQAGDGVRAHRDSIGSFAFGKNARAGDAVRQLVEAMGLTLSTGSRLPTRAMSCGWSFVGRPSDGLDALLLGIGARWSVNGGLVTVLDSDPTEDTNAVLLDADHGLIGSPSFGEKGTVKAKALIQPGLVPGRALKLVTLGGAAASGAFTIQKADLDGDTHGQPWYVDLEIVRRT